MRVLLEVGGALIKVVEAMEGIAVKLNVIQSSPCRLADVCFVIRNFSLDLSAYKTKVNY